MKYLNRNAKYSELNQKIRPLYDLKQTINNSKMPEGLKKQAMKWCDQEINKFWRWCYERRKGYSVDSPPWVRMTSSQNYKPVCPYKMDDCINDPAYLQKFHPDVYTECYNNLTPWQAAEQCRKYHQEDSEYCCCYDDEDK